MTRPRLLIMTDLDGTLLDHESYHWEAARPALQRLAAANIPVIINSSKTAAEIRELRGRLNNNWPFVAENGAFVVISPEFSGNPREQTVTFGATLADIHRTLDQLRADGFRFRSFRDMSVAELAALTSLPASRAQLARQRSGTEPLVWQGSEPSLVQFEVALQAAGLRLVRGGRFFHVMGPFDKADGVRFLLGNYRERFAGERVVAIGLGDSPNDQQMLEAVDVPVIIRGVRSDRVILPSARHGIRSLKPGPEGWNECVLNLLIEYGY